MSTQITTAHVQSFREGIDDLARQKGSRLRGAVRVETGITGDREFYDQVGATAMSALVSRHADTPLTDTPHARRMVTLTPFAVADLIDESDLVRVLNDPRNAYSRSMADAAGHTTDDTLATAFFAAASTGVDGSGSTALVHQITTAGELTLPKLVDAKKILMANEEMPDEPWYFAYSAEQLETVLNDSTITSADYHSVRMLVKGEISSFMGFEWIHTERLPDNGSSRRRNPAWVKSAMLLGVGMETRASIRVRSDKNDAIQIRYAMDIGATRMRETGVVDILNDE